ncbi:MAG: TetR/AcrR family transcriptional regulator, partial [Proteobacteria bacterium]|nr:TetR/AcrR family transcriptional regulator [Pseudomonadota bacterium]
MKNKVLSRREREKLRQRHDIIKAALDLFSEFGYHNVSMHKIAKKAEFAIGTMYKFFPNKEELYLEMIMEFSEKANAVFIEALEIPGNEIEKIRNYVKVKGEVLMENEATLKLYIDRTHLASTYITASFNEDIQLLYEKLLMKLADVFEAGIKAGLFKPLLTPYYLAISLNSIISSFLLLWLRDPKQHPYTKNAATILDLFLTSIKSS